MKRILIFWVVVSLLLCALIACDKSDADQQPTPTTAAPTPTTIAPTPTTAVPTTATPTTAVPTTTASTTEVPTTAVPTTATPTTATPTTATPTTATPTTVAPTPTTAPAPTVYLVKYVASEGGYINGDAIQSVEEGKDASPVEAIALQGYRFAGWSDHVESAARADENVNASVTYEASFVREFSVSFLCAEACGKIEGETTQTLLRDEPCTSVKAVANLGYRFLCWSNGSLDAELTYTPNYEGDETVYAIFEVESMDLPIISIVTEDGERISTKENYVSCAVSVTGADAGDTVSAASGKIKLRGNSTAYLPKSPYKLKFDEKIDLFGNGKAKTWTLIANYLDFSLIRNYLAYSLGEGMEDVNYVTSIQFADVYVNGSYDGVYLICEQVEVGKDRVDIDESYDTADTGYLIEMDGRAPSEGVEGRDYFTVGEGDDLRSYAIKSPDPEEEEFTEEHVAFIRGYFMQCMEALASGDFEQIKQLIDVNTFADTYILNELFHCVDVGYTSFYMYKDVDGKLCSGPIWDYDLSLGNCSYNDQAVDVEHLWARAENIWYAKLFEYDEFEALVSERLETYVPLIEDTIAGCLEYVNAHADAFERNFERWELLGVTQDTYVPEEIYTIDTWQGQVQYVADWLAASLANLRECYPVQE